MEVNQGFSPSCSELCDHHEQTHEKQNPILLFSEPLCPELEHSTAPVIWNDACKQALPWGVQLGGDGLHQHGARNRRQLATGRNSLCDGRTVRQSLCRVELLNLILIGFPGFWSLWVQQILSKYCRLK